MTGSRLVAVALLASLLIGCGGSAPTPRPSAAPQAEETAWGRAVANVGPDGRYSLEAALNLFATTYGPLPGVDAAQDLAGEEHVDGTIAIAAVMAHASALTAEQRSAIDSYLAPPADADVITIPPVAESKQRQMLAMGGFAALAPDVRQAYEDAAN